MKKTGNDDVINRVVREVVQIKENASRACFEIHSELRMFDSFKDVRYLPNPFEIANFYGIEYKFIELEGDMPSYLRQEGTGVICISKRYPPSSYEARILCAHELGHYFLHGSQERAMNNDILNEYLPKEIEKEYEASVFAVLLMPQIMAGEPWESYSPKKLIKKVYEKATGTGGK